MAPAESAAPTKKRKKRKMKTAVDMAVTLREFIKANYSDLKFRKSVLCSDLFSAPLGQIWQDPQRFLCELKVLPNAGVNTVEALTYIFDCEFKRLSKRGEFDTAIDLPRKIKSAIGEWLHENERQHVEFSPVRGSFVTGSMDESDKHPFWLLEKVRNKAIYYLPKTLPDVFKTKAIWRAECDEDPGESRYNSNLRRASELAIESCVTVNFVIDQCVWNDLVLRRGLYEGLSQPEVDAQISIMETMGETYKDRVSFEVTNFANGGLSNCLVLPNGFVSTFVFGGYYISKDPRLIGHVHRSIVRSKRTKIFSEVA